MESPTGGRSPADILANNVDATPGEAAYLFANNVVFTPTEVAIVLGEKFTKAAGQSAEHRVDALAGDDRRAAPLPR